jgi:hypothetical protein
MWPHFDLSLRLNGITAEDNTCLDLGCGAYNSDVAKQVLEYPWKALTSVDNYKVDLDKGALLGSKASKHEFKKGDVRDWAKEAAAKGKKFDITMSFDVLEHLTKEDGLVWLADLDKITSKRIVLFLPIEPEDFYRKNPDPDNVLQEHLSRWRPHELQSLGYKVEEINDCHSEEKADGSRISFGAMWAIKNL